MTTVVMRGRSESLSRALSTLRRTARTGQGALVVIAGEPGIGKSTLLRSVAEQATRSGYAVGVGKAQQGDQIAPGAPLLVALRSGPRPLLDTEAFTSLAPLYDRPLWLVDRISAVLEELATASPIVIAIDDFQWADPLTRFALRVLPARLAGSPVVWVLTSRWAPRDPIDDAISGTDDSTTITRITLGPLVTEDIDGLAQDRLGAPPSAETRLLLDGVGGNPFWAVQVIDGLARRRERGEGVTDMYSELLVGIGERLAGLSAPAAALVRLAAVWGRRLSTADAARLLDDTTEARVTLIAREGTDNGLLGSAGGDVFFPHDLVRQAVYADIDRKERHRLHRHCARYIVATTGSALAAATHFSASATEDDDEAILALLQAARDCVTSMPEQAAELARQAYGLTSQGHPSWLPAGERTCEILVDVQRERDAVTLADRLLAVAEDVEAIGRIQLQACRALWCTGDCVQMQRRAEDALSSDDVSDALRAQLASARALAATRTESAADAEAMGVIALAEGVRVGDRQAQRMALLTLIESARYEGRHLLALDRFAELRHLSESAHMAEEIRTLQNLDRYDEAEARLAQMHQTHDDLDALLPSMLYAQMWQDHNLARLDATEAGARTLLRLADEIGNYNYRVQALLVLSSLGIYRGDLEESATIVASVVRSDREASDESRVTRLRLAQGWISAERGDFTASVEFLKPLLGDCERFQDIWPWSPPWMRYFAWVGMHAGDGDMVDKALHVAELLAERNPGNGALEANAQHVRGLQSADAALLAKAVDGLRLSPRPLTLADALNDLGSTLLDQGRLDEGVVAVREAVEIYHRVGAVNYIRAATATLRRHGVKDVGPARRRQESGWAALTPTELLVVELVGSGHSNRSAAHELRVSPNTINTHLRAIFRKLDVRSRVQLSIAHRERVANDRSPPAD